MALTFWPSQFDCTAHRHRPGELFSGAFAKSISRAFERIGQPTVAVSDGPGERDY